MNLAATRFRASDFLIAAALATAMFLCGAYRLTPGVTGVVHDDGIYVATARSLAEGTGYRLIDLPGAPLQTKYPILYPLLLAIIWKVFPAFPANVAVMQAVTLAMGALAIGLGFLFLVRFQYGSRSDAAAAGLLCATAPVTLFLATQTLSDLPFALLFVIALWAGELALPREIDGRGRRFATGCLIALPYLCRTSGVTVILTTLLFLARARRSIGWTLGGVLVVAGPWFAWSVSSWYGAPAHSDLDYYTNYLSAWRPIVGSFGPAILLQNAGVVIVQTAALPLAGLYLRTGPIAAVVLVMALALGILGWAAVARDAVRGRLLAWNLSAYVALTISWPWLPSRFLVPVSLFLMCYVFQAIDGVSQRAPRIPRAVTRTLVLVSVLIAFGANLATLSVTTEKSRATGYPDDAALTAARQAEVAAPWRAYEEVFGWLRLHAGADDVVAAGSDTMMFLYTNRRAVRPAVYRPEVQYGAPGSVIGTTEEVLDILRRARVRFLVLDPGYSDRAALEEMVRDANARSAGTFVARFQASDPRLAVMEFRATVDR